MDSDGNITTERLDKCIYFNLEKERYTPYTTFKGSFIISEAYKEIISIAFGIDGEDYIHFGSVDVSKMTFKSNYYRLDIVSRSYTLALGLNQPKPQINTSVSLSNLLSRNVSLKNITCESGTKTINYIYVLENSTLWDAVVAYSLKAYGTYPFIYKTNEVRVTAPAGTTRSYSGSIIEKYSGSSLSNLISNIHMKDSDGNYETYNLEDSYAISREIIRHKQIPIDMQWLSDTDMALNSRINYSKRASKYIGIKVSGYLGEELFDKFTYQFNNQTLSSCAIHRLIINGSNNAVYTTMYQYLDAYNS